MSNPNERFCVLLSLAPDIRWAVPQNALGELVTVIAGDAAPPPFIQWRGVEVPVLDFGRDGVLAWHDFKKQSGLVAVFLGLQVQKPMCWGVALRGSGPRVRHLDLEKCPEIAMAEDKTLAAFEFEGEVYRLPDLPALQAFACQTLDASTA